MHFDPLITSIGTIIALGVGAWLKKNPSFNTKAVPWVTFIISILTQIVGATSANAGFNFGHFLGSALSITTLIQAIVQTLLATGAHSFTKNAIIEINKK